MTEDQAVQAALEWGSLQISHQGEELAALWRPLAHLSTNAQGQPDGTPMGGLCVHVETAPPSRINALVIVDDLGPGGSVVVRHSPYFVHCGTCGKTALWRA